MTDTKATHIKLNTGAMMPIVGFGTFLAKKGEVAAAVESALKIGYRHIDCASVYENEAEIGEVFSKVFKNPSSGIKREDVFITSKLWVTDFHPDKAEPALKKTLKDLQLDYVDLYLMHVPIPSESKEGKSVGCRRSGYSLHDTWKVLEKCHAAGLARAIGVSNFPAVLINDFQNACKIVPAAHQIELHPYLSQSANVAFNKSLGIALTAYAPLGAPGLMSSKYGILKPLMENDVIATIAAKHGKTAAQVLIRWSVDRGISVIPKSVTPARIAANFDVFNFHLDADDLAKIAELDVGLRTFGQDHLGVPTFL